MSVNPGSSCLGTDANRYRPKCDITFGAFAAREGCLGTYPGTQAVTAKRQELRLSLNKLTLTLHMYRKSSIHRQKLGLSLKMYRNSGSIWLTAHVKHLVVSLHRKMSILAMQVAAAT